MGCDEQNLLPVSIRTMQRHPVRQGWVLSHPPPHEAKPLASIRSCRAESVPAQRTAATIAMRNTVIIFFVMTTSFLMKAWMIIRIVRNSLAAAQALCQFPHSRIGQHTGPYL